MVTHRCVLLLGDLGVGTARLLLRRARPDLVFCEMLSDLRGSGPAAQVKKLERHCAALRPARRAQTAKVFHVFRVICNVEPRARNGLIAT